MTQVVAVQQIDLPFLAATHQQVRMRCASNGIRQHDRAARAQVDISSLQAGLVVRSKIIRKHQVSSLAKLEKAVAKVPWTAAGVESSIATNTIDGSVGRCRRACA